MTKLFTTALFVTAFLMGQTVSVTTIPGNQQVSASRNTINSNFSNLKTFVEGLTARKSVIMVNLPTGQQNNAGTAGISGGWSTASGGPAATAHGVTGYPLGDMQFADSVTSTSANRFIFDPAYDGGTVSVYLTGVNGSGGNVGQTVRMNVGIACVASGTDITTITFPNAVNVDFTLINNTGSVQHYASATGITATNCTAGNFAMIRLQRLGSDAADTATINMYVNNVGVRYLANLQ